MPEQNKLVFIFNLVRGGIFLAAGIVFLTDIVEKGHEKLFNIFGVILILYGAFRLYRTIFIRNSP